MMVEEKSKEIGIRKILGASVFSICAMISKEFLLLVSLAFVIASPMAYLIMHKWIQEFAYHIDNQWLLYLLAGMATIFLVLVTVCSITIRNSGGKPADRLRYE
jgi:putative ABC transport system permease protein